MTDISSPTQWSEAEISFYSDPLNPTPHQQAGGSSRPVALYLLLSALIGTGASGWLLYEESVHKANPATQLSCSINSAIDCGASMDSVYGHMIFGMPNAIWGVLGFSVMVLLSAWLVAGKTFPRWVWAAWTAGAGAALLSVFFFLAISISVLGVLCPYCLLVWCVSVPLLGVLGGQTLRQGATLTHSLSKTSRIIIRYSWVFSLVIYLIITLVILFRFGQTLLG